MVPDQYSTDIYSNFNISCTKTLLQKGWIVPNTIPIENPNNANRIKLLHQTKRADRDR
jgi:hypothetical protein